MVGKTDQSGNGKRTTRTALAYLCITLFSVLGKVLADADSQLVAEAAEREV